MITRRAPLLTVFLLAGALVAPAGPAAAASREQQQLMAELRMLQEQNAQLQQLLQAVSEHLRTVTARLDTEADANRKAFADQRLMVEGVSGDLRVLREKMDDSAVRIAALSQEVEALRASMPPPGSYLAAPPSSPDGAAGTTPPSDQPAAAAPPPINPAAGMSPQRLYETAYADYASGQWALAIAGFETFLRTFPRSEFADRAQYYIGESYLLDGQFEAAVKAYDAVIAGYPTGTQAPFAHYKRGVALARLGQNDRAREAWQRVIDDFPNSDAAALARQSLERLQRPRRD